MFAELTQQLASMESFLLSRGYNSVDCYRLSVDKRGEVSLSYSASDDFQQHVAEAHKHAQASYGSIYGDTIADIWTRLYALPSRAERELTVLANQLSGIYGMEQQLQSALVQRLILPILEHRNELKRYLMAPITVALDDEILY